MSEAFVWLLQAEVAAQRKTVQSLPRMWQLLDVISFLPAAAKKARDPALMYKGTFCRQGSAATFVMPDPLTPIPLDPPCMPSLCPIKPPWADAQAVSEPKPSAADHASAHMPTSASLHIAPATTTTHQPSTAAAEPRNAAEGHSEAPSNNPTQQGSAHQPMGSVVQPQSPLTNNQPLQQASYLAQQKAPLQHDPTVQNSAACQEADLVLTEAAYECLTATGMTPGHRGNWEIPFIVQRKLRQVSADPRAPSDFERHTQQVLLDMPLPKRLLNLREKHEMLYQHAVCQMGCSLFSQLQQEAAGEAGMVAGNGVPQQQEDLDEMLTDDDQMRPRWPSEDQPGAMPYSPSQDVPYPASSDLAHSSSHDANLVHSMTGLTENSSLMPSQQPQPADNPPSAPEPTSTHLQHDVGASNLSGVTSLAQASAPQGVSMAHKAGQGATPQSASQIGSPAREGDQLRSEAGYASPADPWPAALPAAASADLWSALDIEDSHALDHAADDAQDAAPQGNAASQHGQGGATAGKGAVDASKLSDSHDVRKDADNLPTSGAQQAEAGIADAAQHGEAGKAYNAQHGEADDAQHGEAGKAQHGEAGLSYRSYTLGGYSVVARTQTPLTVPPRPLGEVTICSLVVLWAPSISWMNACCAQRMQ